MTGMPRHELLPILDGIPIPVKAQKVKNLIRLTRLDEAVQNYRRPCHSDLGFLPKFLANFVSSEQGKCAWFPHLKLETGSSVFGSSLPHPPGLQPSARSAG